MAAVDPAYGYGSPATGGTADGATGTAGRGRAAAGASDRASRGAGGAPRRAGLVEELHGLIDDVRASAQARARLFALETRRAGLALAQMLMLAVVGALLLLTAWFALVAAGVALAVSMGGSLWWVLLATVALNIVVAALLFVAVRRRVGDLKLNATLRHLGRVSPRPAPPEADTTAAERAQAAMGGERDAARPAVPPRSAEAAEQARVAAVPLGER